MKRQSRMDGGLDYPGPKVYGCLSPDDRSLPHVFDCEECGETFEIEIADYNGQFDHDDSYPICLECQEKIDAEPGRSPFATGEL